MNLNEALECLKTDDEVFARLHINEHQIIASQNYRDGGDWPNIKLEVHARTDIKHDVPVSDLLQVLMKAMTDPKWQIGWEVY